jgi:hypothetical protein
MDTTMTRAEREAFLDVHVGVLSIGEFGHGTLTAPIGYGYEPGGGDADIAATAERRAIEPNVLVRIEPERGLSVDYRKAFA